ncbi:valine--pyruvate transaminase [Kingella negevensis]|uniref:Putative 8-amino-7-oxononanoate synthase n=1 Tax=Kingella negevensis TaxID=1522312 RepID=A0A238HE21_9NEIS|nr:valine--pyruvate transaminase [Kingella negevensis]MDK4683750.1 valine--pyruvate transaminase [Kingella negevensis]MDK4697062.1 valine--pyruvate transaminase [Kingella negevensis]MDK4708250.1 valine--pyruvate transaminase [Kingella negevensis]MDK4709086.1 valine--pyruvate transaminase [Kingella negevensis]SNB51639.1 Valine--pyruvate aminotransferase [Kingella negevensis]
MQFSNFGNKFTQKSGILQLMDDLGTALNSDRPINMLGGGNPARIPEVNQAYQKTLEQIVANGAGVESVGNYSTPQGDTKFVSALVDFFNREYNWGLTSDNIALTNGSQNAFFYLFNLFGGKFADSDKAILLPLAPEYIGYADVHVEGKHFISVPPKMEDVQHEGQDGFYKYRVDFDALENLPELQNGKIGAICCSRPTNPTGNVLTDDEMARLDALAQKHNIPLIIDNAYGMPFPNIIYSDVTLTWHSNIILCFSLSKIGLPGVRTGIIVAAPEVVQAISSLNAIVNLAPTRFGGAIATPLLQDSSLKNLADNAIQPFYKKQAALAVSLLKQEFKDYSVKIHKPEGAIFLWVWFEGLPITSQELYERLKAKGTLIIPSEHFFVGLDTKNYRHAHECIRMSIAQPDETLQKGIATIGEVVRKVYDAAK